MEYSPDASPRADSYPSVSEPHRKIISPESSIPTCQQHHRRYQDSRTLPYRSFDNYQHPSSSSAVATSKSSGDRTLHSLDDLQVPSTFTHSTNEPLYKFASTCQQSSDRSQLRYSLTVSQQPRHARMVGSGEKADRRPVDPPPTLRFQVVDKLQANQGSVDPTLLRSPYFICYSTLCEVNPPHEELYDIPHCGKPYMTGSIVMSIFQLREGHPKVPDGHYFLFNDLGVRVEGRYRLKFSVYEIVEKKVYHCATTMTEQFEVFRAKSFPGMDMSTEITKVFANQGFRVRTRTKNGNELLPSEKCKRISAVRKKGPKKKTSSDSENPNFPSKPTKQSKMSHRPEVQLQFSPCYNVMPPSLNLTHGPNSRKNKSEVSLPSLASMLNGERPRSSSSSPSVVDLLLKRSSESGGPHA